MRNVKRIIVTLAALLATGGLIHAGFHFPVGQEAAPKRKQLVRVWVEKQETSVSQWLRKQAGLYEKETGNRVYLRAVPAQTLEAEDILPPDLLISSRGGTPIAAYGYALFLRDDAASFLSPVPTSLLFTRPTPAPGPSPTPGPTPDLGSFSAVLVPEKLTAAFPGGIPSTRIVEDFTAGKGEAAILTAEQASQLSFPFRACPLPPGKNAVSIFAEAATPVGEAFLTFLLSAPAQSALSERGLYAPAYDLYSPADPVRDLIEGSLQLKKAEEKRD